MTSAVSLQSMPEELRRTFFSYAREDWEFVERLVKDLKAAGVAVWVDKLDIGPGQLWDREVEKALHECPTHVTVLSPAAVSSEHVMNEVSCALDEGKRVIPVMYRECEVSHLLRRLQRIDFQKDYRSSLRELLGVLEPSAAPAAKTTPENTIASREVSDSTVEAGHQQDIDGKKSSGRWQIRENIKDVVIPIAGLVVALTTWYFTRPKPKESVTSLLQTLEQAVENDQRSVRKVAEDDLVSRGEGTLPELYGKLEKAKNDSLQESLCSVLAGIVKAKEKARAEVMDRLERDIKLGNQDAFRGGTICADTFETDEDRKRLLSAIEERLGKDGGRCQENIGSQGAPDNLGVVKAVVAEYSFPVTGNAPDFLVGIIWHCRDAAFKGARETAITHLGGEQGIFSNKYKENCKVELAKKLEPLPDEVVREIHGYDPGQPACW